MENKQSAKLLYVVNDSWFFTSHRLPVAVAAVNKGYQVTLVAVEDETSHALSTHGIRFKPWDLAPRSLNPFRELKSFISLFRNIRSVQPDVLHLVTIKSVLYGGIIARVTRVPSVVFAISGMGYAFSNAKDKRSATNWLATCLYRFALGHKNSCVIVQNENDKEFFLNTNLVSEKKLHLIPGSGVDLEEFKSTAVNLKSNTVLFASRMLWDKGVSEFVEASKRINSDSNLGNFVLAGNTDPKNPRSVPCKWLNDLPESKSIQWIGHATDIPSLIQSARVVVLPTTYGEGVPKILIEACAGGRAVVATDWPGCRDAVVNGYNGILVKPGDGKQLSEAIHLLLTDDKLASEYGSNGRKLAVEKFSIQVVIDITLKLYSVLHKPQKS